MSETDDHRRMRSFLRDAAIHLHKARTAGRYRAAARAHLVAARAQLEAALELCHQMSNPPPQSPTPNKDRLKAALKLAPPKH